MRRRLSVFVACCAALLAAACAGAAEPAIRFAGKLYAPDIEHLSVEAWNGDKPQKQPDFSRLKSFAQLHEIELRGSGISDLSSLPDLPQVQVLKILETEIKDLSALVRLPNLRVLHIRGEQQTDYDDIPHAARRNLGKEELDAWINYRGIEDISVLAQLPHLRELHVDGTDIASLDALRGLQNLESLTLYSTWKVRDISVLRDLDRLRHFSAFDLRVESFAPLQYATCLESLELNMDGRRALDDVSWLEPLQNLQKLDLTGTHVKDLDVLRYFKKSARTGIRRCDPLPGDFPTTGAAKLAAEKGRNQKMP